jgi:hypothetical protein
MVKNFGRFAYFGTESSKMNFGLLLTGLFSGSANGLFVHQLFDDPAESDKAPQFFSHGLVSVAMNKKA